MVFIAGIASLLLTGFTAFIALSKKSSPLMRRAAIIALILAGLALAFCSLLLLFLSDKGDGSKGFSVGTLDPVEKAEADLLPILVFTAAILSIIVIIIFASLREQKKQKKA